MAIFLALIIISGAIAIPVPAIGVPIVLQNMFIMLSGGILGAKKGTIVVGVFFILIACGFPFLSGGRGGLTVFVGPSMGYLLGFILCPLAIYLILKFGRATTYWKIFFAYFLGGTVLIDFLGSFLLAHFNQGSWFSGLSTAVFFLAVDGPKVFLAAIFTKR